MTINYSQEIVKINSNILPVADINDRVLKARNSDINH
jgi:hypothetical protein